MPDHRPHAAGRSCAGHPRSRSVRLSRRRMPSPLALHTEALLFGSVLPFPRQVPFPGTSPFHLRSRVRACSPIRIRIVSPAKSIREPGKELQPAQRLRFSPPPYKEKPDEGKSPVRLYSDPASLERLDLVQDVVGLANGLGALFEQRLLVGRQVQRQHLLDAARPVTELRTVGKAILLTTEAVCTKRKTAAGKGRRFLKIT